MPVIIGIDPGLHRTGWGIIRSKDNKITYLACGAIVTDQKQELSRRLVQIGDELERLIKDFNPDQCAIEETFVNKNPLSSLKLGHARGAAILTAANCGLPIAEYAATLVKKSIVGVGRADKNQVMMMVKHLLVNADIRSEDAADALAIAICHSNHANLNSLMLG